jgi:hypothetical protein
MYPIAAAQGAALASFAIAAKRRTRSIGPPLVAAIAAAWLAGAHAQPLDGAAAMRFETYTPCSGNAEFCWTRTLARGQITRSTPAEFERFMRTDKARAATNTLCFDSPGGDLVASVELAAKITERGMTTCVEEIYEEEIGGRTRVISETPICASACVFAFAGGTVRFAADDARIGVHRFAGARVDLGEDTTQLGVAWLGNYLDSRGVNRRLLDIAAESGKDSIRWLTRDEIRRTRLDNTNPSQTPWKIEARRGMLVLTTERSHADGRRVQVFLSPGPTWSLWSITLFPRSAATQYSQSHADFLSSVGIELIADERVLYRLKGSKCSVAKGVYWCTFRTPTAEARQIVGGSAVTVRFETPMVTQRAGVDPSEKFEVQGLAQLFDGLLSER